MKTIEMIALRNITLRSLQGISVRFEKNKPVAVPEQCIAEAMALGAVPVTAADLEKPEPLFTPEPVGLAREEAFQTAIEMLVEENSRTKFTAGGKPTKAAMTSALGFEIDNREINAEWAKYKEQLNEE